MLVFALDNAFYEIRALWFIVALKIAASCILNNDFVVALFMPIVMLDHVNNNKSQ